MTANEVRYRENAASCNIESLPAGQEAPFAAAAMSTSSAMSSAMSSAWSSEATAPPTLDSSASSEPTTTTSMTYDDGSYHWSAPPPAVTSAGAQAVWKRQAGSMMQGDPFLLSTPSAPSITSATQVSSISVVESSPSNPSPYWSSTSSTWSTPTPSINAADPGSTELAAPISQATQDCSIGFIGLFFSTFFGGHTADWSPSSDQYTYFKEFQMWINA
jgi:hypothetical protein